MIEYFRRLRRKRQYARIAAAVEAEFVAFATDSAAPIGYLPSPVPPATKVLADMKALIDAYASLPRTGWDVAEKGPIKLTRWQLNCLKQTASAPLHLYSGTISNVLAVPFVEVDTVQESTPYTEGWITT